MIAAVTLFLHHYSVGERQNTLLPFIGMLLHGGMSKDQVLYIVKVITTVSADEEAASRLDSVERTYDRLDIFPK